MLSVVSLTEEESLDFIDDLLLPFKGSWLDSGLM
jgi:hypothetical protein